MKIDIAKSDLEAALSTAGIAVSTSTELSAHYLFRVRDGKVEVLTQDIRVFARSTLICTFEGKEDEAFTVEAWRVDKWLSGIPDAVVKLSADGSGEVHISSGRSKTKLRSLDPSKFPFWDSLVKQAKTVGSLPPASLSKALSLTRWFISKDENAKPELCQIEAIDGVLWATDRRALSSVEIPALPELKIRISGKDVGALSKFLGLKQTQESDVEIKEASRPDADGGGACALFFRPDGCYLGVTRPTTKFPKLTVDRAAVDDATLKVNRKEFNSAVSVLSAGAPKNHESVTFNFDKKTSMVSLSMPCEAGGTDDYPLTLASVENPEKFASPFTVDFPYIKGVADAFGLDDMKFGVNARGEGGFISFRHSDEDPNSKGNRYFGVIVWRT